MERDTASRMRRTKWPDENSSGKKGSDAMEDVVFVLATIGFFVVSILYTCWFGRLDRKS
jgi:hypothetical protein